MAKKQNSRVHERWAEFRFAVIGGLLAAPPRKGDLRAEIEALAAQEWQHPITGEPVRFGYSTIERWFSVEQIILRSRAAEADQDSL